MGICKVSTAVSHNLTSFFIFMLKNRAGNFLDCSSGYQL